MQLIKTANAADSHADTDFQTKYCNDWS